MGKRRPTTSKIEFNDPSQGSHNTTKVLTTIEATNENFLIFCEKLQEILKELYRCVV